MARPRTLSDKQRTERRKKTQQKVSARRRSQYHSDPAYRKQVKEASRLSYRSAHGLSLRNLRNAAEFLPQLETLGHMRFLRHGDKRGEEVMCFTSRELAVALGGYHPNVFRDWVRTSKFPAPAIETYCPGRVLVYSLEQARRLLTVMGEHQAKKSYLSDEDTDTIAALFAAMRD